MAVLIAPKVCMVTYLRSTEHFTVDLEEIAHALSILFHGEFKVVICCDKTFSVNVACYDFPVELLHCSGTKFNRIFSFIQNDKSGFYLSIDNDIKGNIFSTRNGFVVKKATAQSGTVSKQNHREI